ncbi:histone-lysine N-methyltransferase SETMAR [Trichonephila clavipes]|nr:histone-lysine N-methyltransferase SETMAR [Trichonephila clavipes]
MVMRYKLLLKIGSTANPGGFSPGYPSFRGLLGYLFQPTSYGRTTKQQMNAQDTDTPLGGGRPRSSTWIRGKWSGLLRSGVLLLDDIAVPHTVTAMHNHIATLGWERLHPPPYSPDLATSDFYLFPALKKNLAQSRFGRNVEVKQAIKHSFPFGLAIHQNDHQARRRFVEWAQNEIAVVPNFHKRILFSDEAHFWLNGYVNKQNCRISSEANPQVYVETPLHPEKLTVWGYVKSLVSADKPQTPDHLEDNIRRAIADIRPQMLEKVIENWTSRLDYIRASRGSPMPEILFKM